MVDILNTINSYSQPWRDFMPKYTSDQQVKLVQEFLKSDIPRQTFAKSRGIPPSTFKDWHLVYKQYGSEGLKAKRTPNHYSYETKISAVKAYKNNEGSLEDICMRFGMRSSKQLRYWLIQYNNDKNLTATPVGKKVIQMSRKTTLEERIEVVEYVTNHKHSYAEASEHFKVSYQQARMWVLKARNIGYGALVDNRGKNKKKKQMSEVDKLKLENRQLKSELNRRDAIEAFEKKWNEIQHGE